MVRPKGGGGKAKRQQQSAGKKRKQRDDFFQEDEEDMQTFLGSDEEAQPAEEEEGAEEEPETAEEKRLRLAKAYLDQIKEYERAEGGGGEEGPSDEEGEHEAVAQRLRLDALESMGHLQRRIAQRLKLPELPHAAEWDRTASTSGRLLRGHKLSVTAVALTSDDATVFSVSKDGAILRTDVETGKRERFGSAAAAAPAAGQDAAPAADWVRAGPRQSGRGSLLAAAVSSDGRYLAVGGGDRRVHIWDARSRELVKSFPGHKDAVTGLAFREGTHQLFSASLDRSVKIWSLDDMAYVDTLFGHQAEVLGIDALRAERVVTCAGDRTCRVWKVAEESQLIFRGSCPVIECCRYLTGSEWVTGASGGTLELWSSMRKKPVQRLVGAHGYTAPAAAAAAEGEGGASGGDGDAGPLGAGSVGGDAASWIGAVASCRGSDLVASGAGDGVIRLWALTDAKGGTSKALAPLGGLPARGFVNGLALARSGRFVVAGMGQEPRMGRWLRDPVARNGLLIHRLPLREEEEGQEGGGSSDED